MQTGSTFDILGPVMVGPSSSHTAGALRVARLASGLSPAPVVRARFTLYNSFSTTHDGHGTDRALVAGMLGMDPDDPGIRDSFDRARTAGLVWKFVYAPESRGQGLHPNTVDIDMWDAEGAQTSVRGESVGGGRARLVLVNGVSVNLTGAMHALFVAHRDVPGMLAGMTRALGEASINIAHMSSYRTTPGKLAYAVFEMDTEPSAQVVDRIAAAPDVYSATLVRKVGDEAPSDGFSSLEFNSGADLLSLCRDKSCSIGALMRAREHDLRGEGRAGASMERVVQVMREETRGPLRDPQKTLGGMIGGNAARMATAGAGLLGDVMGRAASYALATLERSASMGVIVAAPTAGASGVLPAALLSSVQQLGSSEEELEEALYCAAAVGALIERNASVSGAEGGCQAEVGSAAAMGAAAVAQLLGADPQTCLDAATTAIANLLGLVCDPVRGLVEVPCQVRNVIGAADAISAAQLAVAGVVLPLPFDEAVDAMREVGRALPSSLRETARGGLAAQPSAQSCASCGICG